MTLISWKAHHPDRHARATAKRDERVQQKPAGKRPASKSAAAKSGPTGRERKDALMIAARELAASGACAGWTHLLEVMARAGGDAATLRLWAGAHDKDEIDLICARRRAAEPKRKR